MIEIEGHVKLCARVLRVSDQIAGDVTVCDLSESGVVAGAYLQRSEVQIAVIQPPLTPARICAATSWKFMVTSNAADDSSDNNLVDFEFIYISRCFDNTEVNTKPKTFSKG